MKLECKKYYYNQTKNIWNTNNIVKFVNGKKYDLALIGNKIPISKIMEHFITPYEIKINLKRGRKKKLNEINESSR